MGAQTLIEGYRRFRANRFADARALYERLAERGQKPSAMVVACCDSRVDPATITDAGPGELFVVRNVANLVPPFAPDGALHGTSAALEFGVRVLEVSDIVVLGHASCGGVRALLERSDEPRPPADFIGAWMDIARSARERTLAQAPATESARQLCCEREIVRLSLENLLTFPWIRARVDAGTLRLHGWHFGIATGELAGYEAASGEFHVID